MKTRLADLGSTLLAGTPSDFGKFIADETAYSNVKRPLIPTDGGQDSN